MKIRKHPNASPKESDIQKACVKVLTLHGVVCVRQGQQPRIIKGVRVFPSNYEKGVADHLCCVEGRYCAVEFKVPGGKLSADQKIFREKVLRAGGVYAVIHSVDECVKFIEEVRDEI